jgi:hypothetical protein
MSEKVKAVKAKKDTKAKLRIKLKSYDAKMLESSV